MTETIKDAERNHWVYRMPLAWRPYLQLSRLDRPIGYWLLALPGWIGLAFASLSHGLAWTDLKWAVLIFIGAIAMRGAGCTYNDIVDQDLDAKVERTALRPIPAGTVSTKQAWMWLLAQCFIGLLVLLTLPRFAQIVALCSIPLVAAYPFMKRITWWPQVWLGLTFNWAVLVAYAIKTGTLNTEIFILHIGLVFWTVGYDTIYACQDMEDDALIGVKSTARRFGGYVVPATSICYFVFLMLAATAIYFYSFSSTEWLEFLLLAGHKVPLAIIFVVALPVLLPAILSFMTVKNFHPENGRLCLILFKRNVWIAAGLIIGILTYQWVFATITLACCHSLTPL